MILVLSVCP